ncbi:YbhB/YbcL family Raf kinase inhibitor-like protein [Raineyella sp.]|uniref:YbhB/YbcL family Raf kinase inhibitor-like protein n=1 Tax=Raineyella sp. TaxID=1911550 RepID=UPI002B2182FC|nr:YbhB/YbcL family Raf kinase inhibitor-like protein [Raineyella sp.]MEA5154241.1 YbhB/YbcL family Raf kinase inhibitor-like protein [Raineyella sp.]
MKVPQASLSRTVRVTSPEFTDGGPIPLRFTCQGQGLSPAFAWSGVPPQATSLAVVVSDPDAPHGTFVHWLVTGLPARDGGFREGSAPPGAREMPNSARTPGWFAPCPPSGTHRYVFAVYVLDVPVRGASSQHVLDEIGEHTVAWGSVTGLVRAR